MSNKPIVLTIAGTDPTCGAGIQADLKAISATGSYGGAIITALVAQNTMGVQAIEPISLKFIKEQFASVFSDLDVKTIKIGMLHEKNLIEVVLNELKTLNTAPIIYDPVMMAKSGALLLNLDAIDFLKTHFFAICSLITPNIPEAEYLLEQKICSIDDMYNAALHLGQTYKLNVLLKGGHLSSDFAIDILYIYESNEFHYYSNSRIKTKNTHGTGCTLSSAIASFIAQGFSVKDAVEKGKNYLQQAIIGGCDLNIGKGQGPVDHFYFIK